MIYKIFGIISSDISLSLNNSSTVYGKVVSINFDSEACQEFEVGHVWSNADPKCLNIGNP